MAVKTRHCLSPVIAFCEGTFASLLAETASERSRRCLNRRKRWIPRWPHPRKSEPSPGLPDKVQQRSKLIWFGETRASPKTSSEFGSANAVLFHYIEMWVCIFTKYHNFVNFDLEMRMLRYFYHNDMLSNKSTSANSNFHDACNETLILSTCSIFIVKPCSGGRGTSKSPNGFVR